MVFDREDMKLGWSASKCEILDLNRTLLVRPLLGFKAESNDTGFSFFFQAKRIR